MITIIHGDNTTASRKKLNEMLVGVENVVRFSAKKDAVADIVMGFDSGELFGGTRTVVLEGVFSLRGKNQEKLMSEIQLRKDSADAIVLYQETVVTKTTLTKFKQANVLGFELPKYFFQFMDALLPHSAQKALALFHEMDPGDAEQLFYSLVKRMRQLLMIKSGNAQAFEELSKMGDWQLGKLSSQARMWQVPELTHFYSELLMLEVGMK